MTIFKCPDCEQIMSVSGARENRRVICVNCGLASTAKRSTETGFSAKPMQELPQYPLEQGSSRPQSMSLEQRAQYEYLRDGMEGEPPPQQGFSGASWVVFVLIFVVGNAILFATTGFVLIPR